MRNKKIVRSFLVLLALVMCFCSVSVTAYAQGDSCIYGRIPRIAYYRF